MTSSSPQDPGQQTPDWLAGDTTPRWRRRSTWVAVALLALAGVGVALWLGHRAEADAPRYVTEPLKRGDLSLTVTANGTLQPTRSVSIGSELSGTVTRVLVDVNDRVKKGQVLVELDTAKLIDQVNTSKAALQSAQATVLQSQATVEESRLALARLEQVAKLSGGKTPAATELDAARATLDRAISAEAAARAGVAQAQAGLSTNQTNLAKASISSPIDGVILTRAVEPGNAVAASLQAVTLFTMAEDLSRMKLSVNVDEADVGQVKEGQTAQFTVSAWPGRKYPANVTRVAFGSTTTDNVVTYTTQLDVNNPDQTLRPGMTATATIAATEHKNVLLVPRSALNYAPTQRAGAPGAGPSGGAGIMSMLMPRPPGAGRPGGAGGAGGQNGGKPAKANADSGSSKRIWVLEDGRPKPLTVTVGLSNGRLTEVSGEGLQEGLPVIISQQTGQASGAAK
ncbi:efflux RND transporter periplasmic adaptor subunit [Ideonella azotifigens]|uniref:Efflux RND transporter periplasmic adaptor subunit n=1 Tax=Ideonella azotifigens TaxID=513160 RepID=A0ABP3VNZ2_9BURK|nr:efflux RND transporter periplasmic adaptor subunit [Ideonella azotifigens]MCD2342994.1 efflux RND transporter periplasmic adaptor subunit [Ideonella azotifigens]